MSLLRRAIIVLVALCCVAVVTAVGLVAAGSAGHPGAGGLLTAIGRAIPLPLPHDRAGYTNVLLLGVGDTDHAGADLTDTMILASIDPSRTRSAVLLSIPRDLYVSDDRRIVPGRINAIYERYKAIETRARAASPSVSALRDVARDVGDRVGIPIDGVIKVDFTGFATVIDAVGGLDVDVPRTLVDRTFPVAEDRVGTLRIAKGMHHFDGAQALAYARSRHSTSDFDRSARQQQILRLLREKVGRQGPLQALSMVRPLLDLLHNHVETTLSTPQLLGLAQAGLSLDQSKIVSVQINEGVTQSGSLLYAPPPALYGNADVLLPVRLHDQTSPWQRVRLLSTLLVYQRDAYLDRLPIAVEDAGAGWQAGEDLCQELRRYNVPCRVARGRVASVSGPQQVSSLTGPAGPMAALLSTLLGLCQARSSGTGYTVSLGRDFRFVPFLTVASDRPCSVN